MIKNNYSANKNYKTPKISDIKSITVEHPKASCKLSRNMKLSKTFSQVGSTGKNSTSSINCTNAI